MKIEPIWTGQTVVCMAPGPSLTATDAEWCRGKARVIVINDAWRLAPWADVLYSSDRQWFPKHRGVPTFQGMKVALETEPRGWDTAYGIVPLKYTGQYGLERSPDGLIAGSHSGYAAINLAVHFGARRIVLLGYDMQLGAGGKPHFFGAHVGMNNPTEALFSIFRQSLTHLVSPLKELGIDIVNCTRETALTMFPRMSLERVLPADVALACLDSARSGDGLNV